MFVIWYWLGSHLIRRRQVWTCLVQAQLFPEYFPSAAGERQGWDKWVQRTGCIYWILIQVLGFKSWETEALNGRSQGQSLDHEVPNTVVPLQWQDVPFICSQRQKCKTKAISPLGDFRGLSLGTQTGSRGNVQELLHSSRSRELDGLPSILKERMQVTRRSKEGVLAMWPTRGRRVKHPMASYPQGKVKGIITSELGQLGFSLPY